MAPADQYFYWGSLPKLLNCDRRELLYSMLYRMSSMLDLTYVI